MAPAVGTMPVRDFRSQVGASMLTNLAIRLCVAWVSVTSNLLQCSTDCGGHHTMGEYLLLASNMLWASNCGRAIKCGEMLPVTYVLAMCYPRGWLGEEMPVIGDRKM